MDGAIYGGTSDQSSKLCSARSAQTGTYLPALVVVNLSYSVQESRHIRTGDGLVPAISPPFEDCRYVGRAGFALSSSNCNLHHFAAGLVRRGQESPSFTRLFHVTLESSWTVVKLGLVVPIAVRGKASEYGCYPAMGRHSGIACRRDKGVGPWMDHELKAVIVTCWALASQSSRTPNGTFCQLIISLGTPYCPMPSFPTTNPYTVEQEFMKLFPFHRQDPAGWGHCHPHAITAE